MDVPGAFSLETVMEQDAQQCINGKWESQDAVGAAHHRHLLAAGVLARVRARHGSRAQLHGLGRPAELHHPARRQRDAGHRRQREHALRHVFVVGHGVQRQPRAPGLDAGLGHLRQGGHRLDLREQQRAARRPDQGCDRREQRIAVRRGGRRRPGARVSVQRPARASARRAIPTAWPGRSAVPPLRRDPLRVLAAVPPGRPRHDAEPDHRERHRRLRVAVPVA